MNVSDNLEDEPAVSNKSDLNYIQTIVTDAADRTLEEEDDSEGKDFGHRVLCFRLPFLPTSRFMNIVDVVLFFTVLYVATVTIFVMSFIGIIWIDSPLFWIERSIDIIWLIDIVASFVTSHKISSTAYEPSLRMCAMRYLRRGFVVDAIAFVPWDIIAGVKDQQGASIWHVWRLLRLLRLLKIAKIGRIMDSSAFFVRLEVWLCVKYALLRIILLVTGAFFVAHWVACLFYFFAYIQNDFDNVTTWIDDLASDGASSNFDFYIGSLYFSVYTITTIGFGDVTPRTTLERVYTTIIMMLGAAIFAYLLSNVNALVNDLNSQGQSYRVLMDRLSDYAKTRHLNPAVHFKVRQYFKTVYRNRLLDDDDKLLNNMTPDLRAEVTMSVYGPVVQKIAWFENANQRVLGMLCTVAMQMSFGPNENIYRHGDECEGAYVILHGVVHMVSRDESVVTELREGGSFGTNYFVLGRKREYTAKAISFVDLLFMKRTPVLHALESMGSYDEIIRSEIRSLWRRTLFIAQEQSRFMHIANELYSCVKTMEQLGLSSMDAAEHLKRGKTINFLMQKLGGEATSTELDSPNLPEPLSPKSRRKEDIKALRSKVQSMHRAMQEIMEQLQTLE
eukprot:Plantae.Rhodophyta-Purpureofilum_apyrenoidigerum.ctg11001.p1 GENE.Plantae.Rhodophyta-Purpureofilum_apyrenoidigerum.ctg11001~~Plantae.Rhodophyta-Purpureofilum_apyrenoidigerum.ctg11001.p1  ORF type:complete len:655 (+),score=134.36 Plantae.Rhodophyta-Purpureofilum_apyrenoidigerum.ctg11001:116-1966(+)